MQRGKNGVRDRVEIFVADGRQVLQTDAAIGRFGMALAAIDRDLVPARASRVESSSAKVSKPP